MKFEGSPEVKALLDPDEILKQEFEYAREASLQANNDRTQVVNLYLLLVGGLGSILLALPSLGPARGLDLPPAVYATVFFMVGVLGLFTVLKLIWLRRAWHDSVLTMNQIKDFYLAHYPGLAPAFRWRTETIPAPGKIGTITFDLVIVVALMGSLAVGGGASFFQASFLVAGVAGLLYFALQVWLYFRLLRR